MLPDDMITSFMMQICLAIAYCHTRRIMHRDLKPQNILVNTSTQKIKIADFGLGRPYTRGGSYTNEVVTLWYRPPELLLGQTAYEEGIDMWSIGCIFAEMAQGLILFKGDSETRQLMEIFKVMGASTPEASIDLRWPPCCQSLFPRFAPVPLMNKVDRLQLAGQQLLSALLAMNPTKRISARAAVSH